MRIDVNIENHQVVDAYSSGIFFRGIEKILQGRDPRDAVYLTQRICGICSTAHGMASSLTLEDAFKIKPPRNGIIVRNLIFGADLLQNHIRQFYFLTIPDFVRGPDRPPFVPRYEVDYRLSQAESEKIYENYMESIQMSRMAHDMVTIFGGKIPHNHGILPGGATVAPTGDNIRMFLSMLLKVQSFIENKMMADLEKIATAYDDYYKIGIGTGNLMAFGMFPHPDKKDEFYFEPGVIIGGKREKLDAKAITEHVKYSWYKDSPPLHPEKENGASYRQKGCIFLGKSPQIQRPFSGKRSFNKAYLKRPLLGRLQHHGPDCCPGYGGQNSSTNDGAVVPRYRNRKACV